MTLPDFLEFEPLNQLRRLMNAPLLQNFTPEHTMKPLTYADLDKALEGIEGVTVDDIDDVKVLPDGTLAYENRRVLLYIRDKSNYHEQDPRDLLPSFHVSNCRTLKRMREGGHYERYVITQRTDGRFKMNFLCGYGKQQSEIHELKVCRDCLGFLSYNGYRHTDPKRHAIHSAFSLSEYFTLYLKNFVPFLPLHTDDTAPINEYGEGFREASQRYRAENGWTCQNCLINLSHPSYHKYLHTHHINAQKNDDRIENHKALCIRCHAEEPMHAHLRNSPDYWAFVKIYAHLLHQVTR